MPSVPKNNSSLPRFCSAVDCAEDPEQEFLLRLEERHGGSVDRYAILQCVIGDLKSYSDLKPFLDFERKQTTAPHKLKNPAGHYRRTVNRTSSRRG